MTTPPASPLDALLRTLREALSLGDARPLSAENERNLRGSFDALYGVGYWDSQRPVREANRQASADRIAAAEEAIRHEFTAQSSRITDLERAAQYDADVAREAVRVAGEAKAAVARLRAERDEAREHERRRMPPPDKREAGLLVLARGIAPHGYCAACEEPITVQVGLVDLAGDVASVIGPTMCQYHAQGLLASLGNVLDELQPPRGAPREP